MIFAAIILILSACNMKEETIPAVETSTVKNKAVYYSEDEIKKMDPIGEAKINTKVDGINVEKVSLHTSTDNVSDNAYLPNNTPVYILKQDGAYYLVCYKKDRTLYGFCLPDFLKSIKMY